MSKSEIMALIDADSISLALVEIAKHTQDAIPVYSRLLGINRQLKTGIINTEDFDRQKKQIVSSAKELLTQLSF